MRYDLSQPWAIHPAYAAQTLPLVLQQMAAGELKAGTQQYLLDAEGSKLALDAPPSQRQGMIAVVPLSGPLSPEGEYGGTRTNNFRRNIAALDANSNIAGIVIDITSPGGTVTGTMEAADALRAVRERGQTPTLAVANGMMASAATWIGTAAGEVVVTPSGEAGSIGVISIYTDASEVWKRIGVNFEIVRSPENKARFTGVEPLTDDMRETLIDGNERAYGQFKQAMAANRGIQASEVEAKFGGGEMLDAEAALSAGLVDRIDTLEGAISTFAASLRDRNPVGRRADAAAAKRKLQLAALDL